MLLVGLAAVAACGGQTKQAEDQTAKPKATPTTEAPEPVAKTTPQTKAPELKSGAKVATVETGFSISTPKYSDTARGIVGVVLENQGDETATSTKVSVNWVDAAGTPLKTEDAYGPAIAAGAKAFVVVSTFDLPAGAVNAQVTGFFGDEGFSVSSPKQLTVTAAGEGRDELRLDDRNRSGAEPVGRDCRVRIDRLPNV